MEMSAGRRPAATWLWTTIESPVGALTLVAGAKGLAAVLWPDDDPRRVPLPGVRVEDPANAILAETARQLDAYFAGALDRFTIPLDFHGTAFQRSVWHALLTIPYGETRSYAEIARQLGRPAAARAVGAANGRNPISIIAPCHRVVGSSGALTGFAGGLAAKRYLLAFEGRRRSAAGGAADAGDAGTDRQSGSLTSRKNHYAHAPFGNNLEVAH